MPFSKGDFERLRNRDQATTKRLYEECFESSTRRVRSDGGTLDDAKDVFAEALLSLFSMIDRKPDFVVLNLCGYLYGACNYIWWSRKRESSSKRQELPPEIGAEDLDIEALEEQEKLFLKQQECIKKLKPEQWRLLNLFFYQGKRDKEIAGILEYSPGYVKNKRRRIINHLRECMGLK